MSTATEMAAEVRDRFTIHYAHTWKLAQSGGDRSRDLLATMSGSPGIPDLKILRREAKAWNRRMNRDRVKIAWKFDRKTARRKFGYKRKSFTRSEG